MRAPSGDHAGEVASYANTAALVLDEERFFARNWAAFGIYGLVALVLALPVCRGWGSMLVRLEYASTGKGFFSIRIARRPGKAKKGNAKRGGRKHRFQQRLRSLGRFARTMAGRETLFRWLPARTYYVMVHGLLEDPLSGEVIGNYFEEKKVTIERGERVELHFDFRPKEAPVSVQVWAGALTDQAGAVERYRRALALGGTAPLPELYATAGARFALDAETLGEAVALIERTVAALEPVAAGAAASEAAAG